jgi:hypothetical protein
MFDDERLLQFDGGAGYRSYNGFLNCIVGVNGFHDYRDTGRSFQQLGLGGELLGDRWEFRGNLYLPIGLQHQLLAQGPAVNGVQFVGYNIALGEQPFLQEVAMRGFDLEVGRSVPILPRFDPRAYLGFYHFDAEGAKTANGILNPDPEVTACAHFPESARRCADVAPATPQNDEDQRNETKPSGRAGARAHAVPDLAALQAALEALPPDQREQLLRSISGK